MALNLTGNDIIDASIIRNSTQAALNGSGVEDFILEDDTIKLITTDDEFSIKLPSASNALTNDDIGTKVAPLENGVVPSDKLPSGILTNNDIGTKLPPLVDGRIPTEYMPEQALIYQGTWNASTNTPTIANGVGTLGDFYICNVPGTWSSMEFSVGDWVLYNGTTWEKSANQIPKYNPSGTAGYIYGSNDEYSSVELGRAIYLVDNNGNNIRILKTNNSIQVDYLDGNTPIKSTIIANLDGTATNATNAVNATNADKVASAGVSGMWIHGRANAICKTTSAATGSGWKTLTSIKTSSGSIEIGNLSGEDYIRVVYSSDTDVSAGNNNVSHIMQLTNHSVEFPTAKASSKLVIPIGAPSSAETGCIWVE